MRDQLPSFTACVVAWARATASMTPVAALNPGDQVMRALLPRPFSLAADVVAQAGDVLPLLPKLTPQQVAELLNAPGFTVVSDTHTPDWLKTYAPSSQRTTVRALERIVHARV